MYNPNITNKLMPHTLYSNQVDITNWLDSMKIKKYHLLADDNYGFVVDVDSDVILISKRLKFIPVKFGVVRGTFACHKNELTSLLGCPTEVDRNFYCSQNKLTSLQYSPMKVGSIFDCSDNKITNLLHTPFKINEIFAANDNLLTSLDGVPQHIKGDLMLENNLIDTFKFIPKSVKGNIWVRGNSHSFLDTLEEWCYISFEQLKKFHKIETDKILLENNLKSKPKNSANKKIKHGFKI